MKPIAVNISQYCTNSHNKKPRSDEKTYTCKACMSICGHAPPYNHLGKFWLVLGPYTPLSFEPPIPPVLTSSFGATDLIVWARPQSQPKPVGVWRRLRAWRNGSFWISTAIRTSVAEPHAWLRPFGLMYLRIFWIRASNLAVTKQCLLSAFQGLPNIPKDWGCERVLSV